MQRSEITFRALETADLAMLHGWLNEPGVVRWWEGQDVSWEGVRASYFSPSGDSREQWIGQVDGRDAGWLQCYLARDNPDETGLWWDFEIDERAAGIDYLVADPATRGAGLGAAMIRGFAVDIVLGRHPDWTQVCAGPFDANVASWKALQKAGFRCAGLIEDDADGTCRLMVLARADL